jgi:hypothetical protein
MSTNSGIGIDSSLNTSGEILVVNGGFVESSGSTCGICVYMGNSSVTGTVVANSVSGVIANASYISLSGLTVDSNGTAGIRLGASSANVSMSAIQTSLFSGGPQADGLLIDAGAGGFTCAGSDFSHATTAIAGTVPSGSAISSCWGAAVATLTSCGSSPAITSGSYDIGGEVTEGTSATGCTVSFANTYGLTPKCMVASENPATTFAFTTSGTQVIWSHTSSSNQKFTWVCRQAMGK